MNSNFLEYRGVTTVHEGYTLFYMIHLYIKHFCYQLQLILDKEENSINII